MRLGDSLLYWDFTGHRPRHINSPQTSSLNYFISVITSGLIRGDHLDLGTPCLSVVETGIPRKFSAEQPESLCGGQARPGSGSALTSQSNINRPIPVWP